MPRNSPQTRAATKRHKAMPLSESDWVEAATEILTEENVRGIRIDALCTKLGVTKGSFYWHFANRAELLQAMLSDWRRRMTLNIIQGLSREGSSFDRLRSLMTLPRRDKSPTFARVEQSIRDWGRRVESANEAVTEVDRIRFEYFTQLFIEQGFSPEEAKTRAYLAYTIMMGDSILLHTIKDADMADVMDDALHLLTQPASEKQQQD